VLTKGYAPFEQYQSKGRQGPYTDVYALGAVLYRAVTGATPEDAADRLDQDKVEPLRHRPPPGYSREFLATVSGPRPWAGFRPTASASAIWAAMYCRCWMTPVMPSCGPASEKEALNPPLPVTCLSAFLAAKILSFICQRSGISRRNPWKQIHALSAIDARRHQQHDQTPFA